MSERILNALMQLFAIIAKIDLVDSFEGSNSNVVSSTQGKAVIKTFLQSEIGPDKIDVYLQLFDSNLLELRGGASRKEVGAKKRQSVNSVKILRICSEINQELTQRQKFIVLVRTLELIIEGGQPTNEEMEFVRTVADSFNVDPSEHKQIHQLLMNEIDIDNPTDNQLVLSSEKSGDERKIHIHTLQDPIVVIHISSLNLLFFKYLGSETLFINGQAQRPDKAYLFNQGASIKTTRSEAVYQIDLINRFVLDTKADKFSFEAKNLTYNFSSTKVGIHPFSFNSHSGNLVGVMGGSGTGKSTLISLLNGSLKPTAGSVKINADDVHKSPREVEGLIGHVSQDDLLIEELTVFQNLYYSAKLSFKSLSDLDVKRKVIRTLHSLGLYETKDLRVGSPLEKTISGGQRKRLNICLELIREPSVLFVDEPTSGLSSRDSMNIMNLLKELSFRGKLVFVVIHQPSSEIFKLFNQLLLLDQGGFPIFDGNPIDSLVYFKSQMHLVNADDRECSLCGNVNPEQLFDIIEAKIVDEFGLETFERKTSPENWYNRYLKNKIQNSILPVLKQLEKVSKRPTRFNQFKIFFLRDFLSKISNRQYLLVTLTIAPLLAFLLAFVMKYFVFDTNSESYSFYKNENIPYYIFIAVLNSIFFGMTAAGEEIIKDKKILKRETFLNLSRFSYLSSKVSILIIISALQSLMFVLVGNTILEIKGMYFEYWLVLFSTSVCANLLGLIISSGFNQVKIVYILVPIIIIPQLLFSGALVKFDKLHPIISHPTEVPWVGNCMLSRWSFESLMVKQASDNEFNKLIYSLKQKRQVAIWNKDYWLPEMYRLARSMNDKELISKEVSKKLKRYDNLNCESCEMKKANLLSFLSILEQQYIINFNAANDSLEDLKVKIGLDTYSNLLTDYSNENLENIVTNHYGVNKMIVDQKNKSILQLSDPIYQDKKTLRFLDTPLYSKYKIFFGYKCSTYIINLFVVWSFSLLTFIILYFDLFRKFLEFGKKLRDKN